MERRGRTDFGTSDTYVGVMKGVIAGLAPRSPMIDLSHEVGRHDVRAGALALLMSYRYFPTGTVFCCVVDPGVGTGRAAVAVVGEQGGRRFTVVCPDNGLPTPLLPYVRHAVALDDGRYQLPQPSATFHGRDIFAPAAAHLANGLALHELGSPVRPTDLVTLEWPEPQSKDGAWRAQVIHVDRFGNLISNLPGEVLDAEKNRWNVRLGRRVIEKIRDTFGDVAVGEDVAYIGSSGLLELAVRQGDASREWQAGVGSQLILERR